MLNNEGQSVSRENRVMVHTYCTRSCYGDIFLFENGTTRDKFHLISISYVITPWQYCLKIIKILLFLGTQHTTTL